MYTAPARILYTEDDPDTRELITFVLNQSNCEVAATASQEQALALARSVAFDLYLLDSWLPGLSGTDLCKRLREFDQTTPILFYSGAAYDEDKELALACGAQAYLTKPANPEDLIAEVLRLTAREYDVA
jgi:DNA-binding response OmpR family regulator